MTHVNYPGAILTPNNYIPSSYYRFWCRCLDGSGGVLQDESNQNVTGDTDIDGTVEDNGGSSQAWTNAGWFTSADNSTGAGDETRAVFSAADLTCTSTECFIVSVRVLKASPVPQERFFGNYSVTNGTQSGFKYSMIASGQVNFHLGDGDGNNVSDGTYVVGPIGGEGESCITLVMDNATRKMSVWRRGEKSLITDTDYPSGFGSITNDDIGLALGTQGTGVAITESFNCQFRDLHALVLPSIPANLDQIAAHLNSKPFVPLRDSDIELS